jgi:phospholipid/cholesterol/gamma-HCH transport system substrate-binding protein
MANSERRTELIVGIFLLSGLVLLGGLILQFGRFDDKLHKTYKLTVVFDDTSGLIKGSEVRMGGAKIGKVSETPELNEAVKVEVVLAIDERIKIPSNSNIQIASASVLGDKLIVITPPIERVNTYLEPGQFLLGGGPSGLDAIQDDAEAVVKDVRKLMGSTQGTLIKIDSAVDDLRSVTGRLGETLDKVNVSILSDANLASIDGTIANFNATTEEWKKASAELQPTLADAREAIRSFQKASDGAEKTFATADKTIADLQPAFKDVPKAVKSFTSAADEAAAVLANTRKGDGLLGTLTNDKEVSTDASVFIKNLREKGILRYTDKESKLEDDPRNRFRGKRR